MRIQIIPGKSLSIKDIKSIDEIKAREFKVPPMNQKQIKNSIYFLLKDDGEIKAIGQLVKINGIKIDNDVYSILGIGGIVSNVKLRGYGRKILASIKNYLGKNHITGVGYCRKRNKEFYLKCGINVDCSLNPRLVYVKGRKRITNTRDHCIIYYEAGSKLIAYLQKNSKSIALLPRYPNW